MGQNLMDLRYLIELINAPRPGDRECKKCGCQIFDPFGFQQIIHDEFKCGGVLVRTAGQHEPEEPENKPAAISKPQQAKLF